MDTLIIGLLLGATYCLMALGLTLQYGVARIMNLAAGEWIVVGGFAAFWSFTADPSGQVAWGVRGR
jgi:branched-chain amino acid transport system permease protein